jgi:glutamate--cysteine ligase
MLTAHHLAWALPTACPRCANTSSIDKSHHTLMRARATRASRPRRSQVNLDFESEQDMIDKFRIGLALQPVSTALFAMSPFRDGKPTGYLSWRSHVWTDVDPDRCGTLPWVWEDDFGFDRYVEYALDVPMYFAYRGGKYLDATGLSFRDFIKGELSVCPGARAAHGCGTAACCSARRVC